MLAKIHQAPVEMIEVIVICPRLQQQFHDICYASRGSPDESGNTLVMIS